MALCLENVVTVLDSMVTTIKKGHKKMNEYLYEIRFEDFYETDLTDEEIMYVMANEKLHQNRKKRFQKEKIEHGKESNYDFYC